MAKSIGAKLNDAGHEIQLINDGREIDIDDVLTRLGISHDSADMFSAARAVARRLFASDADVSDDKLKAAIAAQP